METKHITKGKWMHDDGHIFTDNSNGTNTKYNSIASVHDIYSDDGTPECNYKLILEAGNVTNECGLSPRQLLEQRNELLEALQMLLKSHSNMSSGIEYTDIENKVYNAIKKATL